MIHLSEHVKLVKHETVGVLVESHEQNTNLEETMISSQPEFFANASLSSQVLCRKHYIFMYLSRYPAKL